MTITVTSAGIQQLLVGFDRLPADVERALRLAINATVRRARAESGRQIRQAVAFPAHWLSGRTGRLRIQLASRGDLEAQLRGRGRPTALSVFTARAGPRGARVTVKPGASRFIRGARLVPLRHDAGESRDDHGLAVRLRRGGRVRGKRVPLPDQPFLYGPSIDQVFGPVAKDIAPDMADFMTREFRRLLAAGMTLQ